MATTSVNFTTGVAPTVKTRKSPVPKTFAQNLNEVVNGLTRMYDQTADMPGLRAMFGESYAAMLKLNTLVMKAERERGNAS